MQLRRYLVAGLVSVATAAPAMDNDIVRGKAIVEANCSQCHAAGVTGKSSHPNAPEFRNLHQRYPIESLAEALAEGIATGHPDMPEFVATPEQIDAIIAYIGSLASQ
jgi:cytochrome c